MPLYIQKSISAGPFRFNLSSSGLGVSVGVKGLRIGTGPRGHYVRAGLGGMYYRASLGGKQSSTIPRPATRPPVDSSTCYAEQGRVAMVEVQSGDVSEMWYSTVADFLENINGNQAQIQLGVASAVFLALTGAVLLLLSSSNDNAPIATIGGLTMLAAAPAWAIGEWIDSYRRTTVLYYNLQGAAEAAYKKFVESFDLLASCRGKWHIASGGAVQDLTTWKRNAGAAHLINRNGAYLAYALPKVLRSNVTPPAITLGSRIFYFLPELVLVKHRGRFGAVGYSDIQIKSQPSRFIEDGALPADAQVVGSTWKHPNKDGSPDRRFVATVKFRYVSTK